VSGGNAGFAALVNAARVWPCTLGAQLNVCERERVEWCSLRRPPTTFQLTQH
jgi:hypothetical protein